MKTENRQLELTARYCVWTSIPYSRFAWMYSVANSMKVELLPSDICSNRVSFFPVKNERKMVLSVNVENALLKQNLYSPEIWNWNVLIKQNEERKNNWLKKITKEEQLKNSVSIRNWLCLFNCVYSISISCSCVLFSAEHNLTEKYNGGIEV